MRAFHTYLWRTSVLLAPLAAALAVAPAQAGVYVSSYSVPHNVNVHSSGPGGFAEYSGAGQIVLKTAPTPAGPFSALPVWCVDLFDWLTTPATFTDGTLTTNGKGVALSAAQVSRVAALIQHGDAMMTGAAPVTPGYSLNQASAAIQIAIWEVENGAGYTFTSDDGALNGPGGLVARYVGNVTGGAPAWTALPFTTVRTLEAPGDQTQAYASVPEPATLSVLGVGMVGLLALGRRHRRG